MSRLDPKRNWSQAQRELRWLSSNRPLRHPAQPSLLGLLLGLGLLAGVLLGAWL